MTTKAKHKLTDEEALARLENLDPATATVRDRSDTAEIRAAVQMKQVDEAVIVARQNGLTWIEIAGALEVSPQAARKKYFDRV